MRVAFAQFDQAWEDRNTNKGTINSLLCDGISSDLLVLPEMSLTGFSMDTKKTAEQGDTEYFAKIATKYDSAVAFGTVRSAGKQCYNSMVVIDSSGKELAEYAKIHPFSYAGESEHYAAGTSSTQVVLCGMRVSLFICYDLRFAPLLWRVAPTTDLMVVIANWPAARKEQWRTLLSARAIENQCYVLGVNRIGVDPKGHEYSGDSLLIGPRGKVHVDAGSQAGIFSADISQNHVAKVRDRLPFMADRREELYRHLWDDA